MSKVHNFSAGPSILPREVVQKAADTILDLNNSGLSLLEVSHRGKDFVEIMERARGLVKQLLGLGDDYTVLFLQGGASLGFYISALNFMKQGGTGAYLNTGTWSQNAIKEAKKIGNVKVVASSEEDKFRHIPKGYSVPQDADYFHITSNNTIYGTQIKSFPDSPVPLLCDMSSDIFSREFDATRFDLIYAGAQKNMGPAGTTVYIVKKDALGKTGRDLPSMLDLQVHDKKDSMFNTPPVFPVYVSMLMMEWIIDNGGVAEMEKRNNKKAELLYAEIDRNPLFTSHIAKEDRSYMNACFVLQDEAKYGEKFNKMWADANISGLKGHRSTGGYRASIYNAMPIESVQVLVDVMKELERQA